VKIVVCHEKYMKIYFSLEYMKQQKTSEAQSSAIAMIARRRSISTRSTELAGKRR
jgi:hypothetical protein